MHPPGYLVVEELLRAEGGGLGGGGPLALDGEDGRVRGEAEAGLVAGVGGHAVRPAPAPAPAPALPPLLALLLAAAAAGEEHGDGVTLCHAGTCHCVTRHSSHSGHTGSVVCWRLLRLRGSTHQNQ